MCYPGTGSFSGTANEAGQTVLANHLLFGTPVPADLSTNPQYNNFPNQQQQAQRPAVAAPTPLPDQTYESGGPQSAPVLSGGGTGLVIERAQTRLGGVSGGSGLNVPR